MCYMSFYHSIFNSIYKDDHPIKPVFTVDDRYAFQFQSHVFNRPTHIQPEIFMEWPCNEAYNGKSPMNGIRRTMKNLVYRRYYQEMSLAHLQFCRICQPGNQCGLFVFGKLRIVISQSLIYSINL